MTSTSSQVIAGHVQMLQQSQTQVMPPRTNNIISQNPAFGPLGAAQTFGGQRSVAMSAQTIPSQLAGTTSATISPAQQHQLLVNQSTGLQIADMNARFSAQQLQMVMAHQAAIQQPQQQQQRLQQQRPVNYPQSISHSIPTTSAVSYSLSQTASIPSVALNTAPQMANVSQPHQSVYNMSQYLQTPQRLNTTAQSLSYKQGNGEAEQVLKADIQARATPGRVDVIEHLSNQEKLMIRQEMMQMIPMYQQISSLLPTFLSMSSNFEVNRSLMLMKGVFEDQLNMMEHNKFILNLSALQNLREKLTNYFSFMRSATSAAATMTSRPQVSQNVMVHHSLQMQQQQGRNGVQVVSQHAQPMMNVTHMQMVGQPHGQNARMYPQVQQPHVREQIPGRFEIQAHPDVDTQMKSYVQQSQGLRGKISDQDTGSSVAAIPQYTDSQSGQSPASPAASIAASPVITSNKRQNEEKNTVTNKKSRNGPESQTTVTKKQRGRRKSNSSQGQPQRSKSGKKQSAKTPPTVASTSVPTNAASNSCDINFSCTPCSNPSTSPSADSVQQIQSQSAASANTTDTGMASAMQASVHPHYTQAQGYQSALALGLTPDVIKAMNQQALVFCWLLQQHAQGLITLNEAQLQEFQAEYNKQVRIAQQVAAKHSSARMNQSILGSTETKTNTMATVEARLEDSSNTSTMMQPSVNPTNQLTDTPTFLGNNGFENTGSFLRGASLIAVPKEGFIQNEKPGGVEQDKLLCALKDGYKDEVISATDRTTLPNEATVIVATDEDAPSTWYDMGMGISMDMDTLGFSQNYVGLDWDDNGYAVA
ncbi:hypothetical protein EC973_009075 [Apophysomyces ossiformis]|uniref:Uncharacterized protein n=1 Tax=Apophysomyces ossiformis TaxID=679940 RepID=A0A8H7BSI9_9FUNG|nr:hypothetical protein EC973_009075 [Apophysomyces ossiformis]